MGPIKGEKTPLYAPPSITRPCSHHKDGVVGSRVRQGAGSIQHRVDQVVQVIDRIIQFSIWSVVAFKSVPGKWSKDS